MFHSVIFMYCIVLYLLNFIDVHQYSVWEHIHHISQFVM